MNTSFYPTDINLKKLIAFDDIVIQCHDNPDADSIASGFALYTYFKLQGKKVHLIYSGRLEISKPNLLLMVEKMHIPLEYKTTLEKPQLLITIDCQFNGGNVAFFDSFHVAEIDHHIKMNAVSDLSEIRTDLGSCSTLVWCLLKELGFNVNDIPDVATALYYGLMSDTNNLTETCHILDRKMSEELIYSNDLIRQLKASNLSMLDLETAGIALIRCSTNKFHRFAILESRPCDPNILGFISDLAIQVDSVFVCIVYFEDSYGIRFSIRSCTNHIAANHFADYIAKHIGSCGGHLDKAGGYINIQSYNEHYPSVPFDVYFHNKISDYCVSHQLSPDTF